MFRSPSIAVFGLTLAGATPGVAAGPTLLLEQTPCTLTAGNCVDFDENGAVPLIRSYTFTAPAAGRARVSFDGSMQCANYNFGTTSTTGVIDLVSQIVVGAGVTPVVTGPSGAHWAFRMPPAGAVGYSTAFNLHSTRTIAYGAGPKTVYFKMARQRMDVATHCYVHSAVFSVVFVPN